jgi:hypothetical protein
MEPRRKQELEATLKQMDTAAQIFYAAAQKTDFHQFLEFTGFMREYTKVCAELLKRGVDFTEETGELKGYEAQYIGEKFGCIFTPLLHKSPGGFKAFLEGAKLVPAQLP